MKASYILIYKQKCNFDPLNTLDLGQRLGITPNSTHSTNVEIKLHTCKALSTGNKTVTNKVIIPNYLNVEREERTFPVVIKNYYLLKSVSSYTSGSGAHMSNSFRSN